MHKKKNIVHLIPGLGTGGAEKVVLDLCKGIDRAKYDLTVAYWTGDEDLLGAVRETGVRVIKLDLKNVVSPGSLGRIVKMLKDVSADLVHTHFIDADLLGFMACLITGTPLCMQVHSYPFPVKASHRLRYKIMSLKAKRILCVSEAVEKYVSAATGISPGKMSVVYNGITLDGRYDERPNEKKSAIRNALGIRDGRIVVGNVSRFVPDKGHKDLISAIPGILKTYPDVQFLIVGDGPMKGELTALADRLNVKDKVIFTGMRNDVPDLLNVMDIFVFPAFYEALGISLLEAMAAGKPVIAADAAAVPEIIRDGKDGILVHPEEATLISDAVTRLLADPRLAREMGLSARERVKSFTTDKMVKSLERVYADIIPDKGAERKR